MNKKVFITTFCCLFFTTLAYCHESRPLYFKIIENEKTLYFEANIPGTVSFQNLPQIYINELHISDNTKWNIYESGFRQKWELSSTGISLTGAEIRIEYPKFNPVISSIIAYTISGGEEEIILIPPNKSQTKIPKEINKNEVRKQYTILGIEHIWAGIDHLLFLICLFIITGRSKKLFITITGFTIAHSITLVLSALQIIQLPIPPIEASIALSIVFLCYEIIHHHSKKDSLTYRHPILVASSFGLLHGLGFATVLGEIGLPKTHMIQALLFFNIGVEIGQIIFIIAIIALALIINKILNAFVITRRRMKFKEYGLIIPVYAVGTIAAFWMFERIL